MRPPRTLSPESWKAYWRQKDHREEVLTASGEVREAYHWIESRSIKVYCMPHVDIKHLIAVGKGVEDAYKELKLDMRLSYHDMCDDIEKLDLEMQFSTHKNGGLDCQDFSRRLSESYLHLKHAKVFITTQPLLPQILTGRSDYGHGYSIITLANGRERSFLERTAKHEAYHLLGYPNEHSTERVAGYPEDHPCNMQTDAPTKDTCRKCSDALSSFWQGIEARTDSKFFKRGAA